MLRMAKKQSKSEPLSQSSKRKGYNLNVWLRPSLGAAFELYRQSHEFQPDKTAITEAAIEAFLRLKGFWPPPTPE